ncbi:hypothetical protein LTR36_002775 [Oleoguttula mirabilis]|uniref:separase n=1 Tax=Oleoguttula mirabilis TaxID=1507867 RepID=A0AAV9JJI8_9PEZI|nr:hypothetical protein LTR36_002775 [Oleoguttula mirabilis]
MATSVSLAGAVKTALSEGSAFASTTTTLQSLLGPDGPPRNPECHAVIKTTTAGAKVRTTKSTGRKVATKPQIPVLEDTPKALPPKAKYALATDIVNITLKVLTTATKVQPKSNRGKSAARTGTSNPGTPQTPSRTSSVSSRALQLRSGNATPVFASLAKPSRPKKTSVSSVNGIGAGPSSATLATAECARLAFAYLRSVNTEKLGLKDMPRSQLDAGTLALAARLVALGLDAVAIKELRIVKRRLQAVARPSVPLDSSRTTSMPKGVESSEKETLASLLQLDQAVAESQDLLQLAITYQQLVLKLIIASGKPAVIDHAVMYLSLSSACAPANLIVRHGQESGDTAKTAKQLEALAQTLLSLCSSASATQDSAVATGSLQPSPATVFGLQVLALRVRQTWWALAGHKVNHEKELAEPFSKCLAAFARRSALSGRNAEAYASAQKAFTSLDIDLSSGSDETSFSTCRTLALLAESGNDSGEALRWASQMVQICEALEPGNARRISAHVRQATLITKAGLTSTDIGDFEGKLNAIVNRLRDQLSGHSADYDLLLVELAQLVHIFTTSAVQPDELPSATEVVWFAASFAQRYARSYPMRNTAQAQTILYGALRCSKACDDLLKWVTRDAANVFIVGGSLQAIMDVCASKPLVTAWSISATSLALGRVLHALLLNASKNGGEGTASTAYDDEGFGPMERAAMLEWQLMYAVELADRQKHHAALQRLIQDILRKLSELYAAESHPVRRARVAITALHLREIHPDLVPQHALTVWLDAAPIDPCHLAQDRGLEAFAEDVRAGLEVTRAFHSGKPAFASLRPGLLVWQRIVEGFNSVEALQDRVDQPEMLVLRLKCIASYLRMRGDTAAALPVLRLQLRLSQLLSASGDPQVTVSIDLAQQYLELGFSEKAGHTLAQAQKLSCNHGVSPLSKLQSTLAYAEYLAAIDNTDKARIILDETRVLRVALAPENVARSERKAYELIHAQAWLIQSKLCLESGAPHEALAAAKSAVKVLNSAWASLERSSGIKSPDPAADITEKKELNRSDAVTGLVAGVSKLQLTTKDSVRPEAADKSDKGAAFWPILPLIARALLQLSDLYAHHGLFAEANYYSDRAVSLAESTGSDILLSRIRSHRSRLLAFAGRLEDAELCLSKTREHDHDGNSMAQVEQCCARADIRAREGSLEEASQLYQRALQIVETVALVGETQSFERFVSDDETLAAQTTGLLVAASKGMCEASAAQRASARSTKSTRTPASKAGTKTTAARNMAGRKGLQSEKPAADMPPNGHYLLDKVKATVLLENAVLSFRSGVEVEASANLAQQMRSSISGTFRQRRVQFQQLMRRAAMSIQSDMSYSMLPESTLSFPALVRTDRRPSEHGASRLSLLSLPDAVPATAIAPTKAGARKKAVAQSVPSLLLAARDCLAGGHNASLQISSTAEAYSECSMLSSVSMLLSAAGLSQTKGTLHPVREALHIEQPRIYALRCETQAILVDQARSSTPFAWPETEGATTHASITATGFQEQYIDILPRPWTAVSVSLNEDCSELYVARYRSGQSPLILRLPFSRHKQEDDDQEVFDYQTGKAELQDIIQVSNYSCHNTGSIEAKGAKNNWWSEREALDKRLHELLINIENIWFGGFKGVFSQYPRRADLLARFRKSMDDVLARYLPSRQAVKGRTKPLSLDDKVLELFIGLGTDQEGVVDLDEPLADLLYFVVDMLQFNGERNAYDEIDFDSMAVDVLDALRSYHEACAESSTEDQHLILMLDKRLQAFPWESLPYLENASVSRLGSMLSLRQRILAMKQAGGCHGQGQATSCHIIARKSGTYILNPSKDLANTQTTLSAPLSKLAEAKGGRWTSMVQHAPSEDEFRTALADSSMVLYFGHGSGAQYIRPRTIRKLDRCSEVVWLMGCSSGAVTEYGELEPSAVPLAYLMAGRKDRIVTNQRVSDDAKIANPLDTDMSGNGTCMAVVATLWDVTDKDIDRFSLAVGEEWGLWPPSEASKLPAKSSKKRDQLVAPSTPPQVPKTPKARKTPAPAKTPARSRSRPRQEDARKKSLVEAVARSRDACYLRYLNGAAPVVYGVPVYLGD